MPSPLPYTLAEYEESLLNCPGCGLTAGDQNRVRASIIALEAERARADKLRGALLVFSLRALGLETPASVPAETAESLWVEETARLRRELKMWKLQAISDTNEIAIMLTELRARCAALAVAFPTLQHQIEEVPLVLNKT